MSGRCLSSRTWGQAAQILSRLVPASFRNKYWRAGVLGRTLWSSPPRPWPLSVMRTPVALPPSSNGMEQRYGASFLQSNISFRSEPVRTSRTATQGSSRHAAWGSAWPIASQSAANWNRIPWAGAACVSRSSTAKMSSLRFRSPQIQHNRTHIMEAEWKPLSRI